MNESTFRFPGDGGSGCRLRFTGPAGMARLTTTPVVRGFVWRTRSTGPTLVASALAPLAPHAFTTRAFESPPPGGSPAAIAGLFGLPESAVVRVRQVHGAEVLSIGPGGGADPGAAADAIVARDPSKAIAVSVADCVPVLLADRRRRVVAAVHAGWRGTAAGVVGAAVARMRDEGVPASDLVAAIGPSIGPCCYQVDRPVREAFMARRRGATGWFTADGPDRWKLDLWEANRSALLDAGVLTEAIHVAGLCTFHHADVFHSYRREGAHSGRMFAAIRLEPDRS